MKDKKSIFEKIKFIEKIPDASIEQENVSAVKETDGSDQLTEEVEIATMDTTASFHTSEENIEKSDSYISDKVLDVDEIYKNEGIDCNHLESVYIIDSYQKALPETLPNETKRQAVLSILSASDINLDNLLTDGEKRLDILHNFSKVYTGKTEDITKQYEAEIKELTIKIEKCRKAINKRDELQKEQDLKLDCEIQRIENIIKFIKKQ